MAVSNVVRAHFEQQAQTLERARFIARRLIIDYGILSFRPDNRILGILHSGYFR